ncbi:hypothetical protein SD70_01190 [Gordoniibacillus kamchatkensis]|uniref:Uncharacterized protein n=1 Tax=Gordoniibacillus kamchatkensis TaxID=1590651 RepID=A0ABR5AMN1_9BACL|nr:hypothetical protein [Paenibacillus sp. VKM B-2647]KIL42201.1 hypothetical protein SD70_01190 [Paenibacillus sp. VKM B-2647]
MKLNRHSGLAIILILFGGLILLNKLSLMFGFYHGNLLHHFMGWLIPIAMVGLGWYGITRGSKIAWVITILGAIILLGKMSGLIVIVLAAALIAFGVSMLKRSANRV